MPGWGYMEGWWYQTQWCGQWSYKWVTKDTSCKTWSYKEDCTNVIYSIENNASIYFYDAQVPGY